LELARVSFSVAGVQLLTIRRKKSLISRMCVVREGEFGANKCTVCFFLRQDNWKNKEKSVSNEQKRKFNRINNLTQFKLF
jgi:hypothetical protein